MFNNVKKSEYDLNNCVAEEKNKEVDYIIRICEENYPRLIRIFAREEKNKKTIEEKVYQGTKQAIESIETYCTQIEVYEPKNCSKPEMRMGWVTEKKDNGTNIFQASNEKEGICPYSPTKKGFKVSEGLKNIREKYKESA